MSGQSRETPQEEQVGAMSSPGVTAHRHTLKAMKAETLSWKCGFGAHRGAGRYHGRGPDSSEDMWHISRRTQRDPWAETGDTLPLPDAKGAASKTRGKPGERGGRDAKQEGFKGGANHSVKCCQEVKQDKA